MSLGCPFQFEQVFPPPLDHLVDHADMVSLSLSLFGTHSKSQTSTLTLPCLPPPHPQVRKKCCSVYLVHYVGAAWVGTDPKVRGLVSSHMISLRDFLSCGLPSTLRMKTRRIVWAIRVAAGLKMLHEHGIVHRAVHGGNIKLLMEGFCFLVLGSSWVGGSSGGACFFHLCCFLSQVDRWP